MRRLLVKHMRFLMVMLTLAFLAASVLPASAVPTAKVDNFILFLDQSGSMKFLYKGKSQLDLAGQSKVALARAAMIEFNKLVPNLGYKSGVYAFAPFQQYGAMAPYNKYAVEDQINSIDMQYDAYARMTPWGPGFQKIDSTLAGLSGRTALVVFTDGDDNVGIDAVVAAHQLQAKYGDRLCIMIVSFADTAHGQAQVKRIAQLSPCNFIVEGDIFLRDQAARIAFLRCGLYGEGNNPENIIFRSIYFDFDKYNIKREFFPVLDEGIAYIQAQPNTRVVLEGHTDSVGSVPYNQRLSERRANSVKAYFVQKGVNSGRIEAVGFGKLRPRYDNSTAEGRKLNRRVEIKFEPLNTAQ